MKNLLFTLFVFALVISCNRPMDVVRKSDDGRGLIAKNGMVVSARSEASRMGIAIMKKGGNAFDAMAATELTLALTYPRAGNILGGGFMVYRTADGKKGSLDYREKAPMAAHRDMYLDENGDVIPGKSFTGIHAVGVPGTIAGVLEAQRKMGRLSLREVISPIIELAQKGYVITALQAKMLNNYQDNFIKVNGKDFLYTKEGWEAGDVVKNEAYANTLEGIMKYGWMEFYGGGKSGQAFLNTIKEHGGIITAEDLKRYKAVWRDPIVFGYDNYTITSMAPPSSGGITLGQILTMVQPFPLDRYGHNTTKYLQLITEAERRAYADRNYFLGDPDFVDIPSQLLEPEYLRTRMKSYNPMKASLSSEVSHGAITIELESDETTHYSIVDGEGNAVAVTTTLNGNYGSNVFCEELGVFMNNEMDDFSAKPGVPNAYGLVGAEANSIAPEKRMLSSMTPTIVEKDGQLFLVVGTPGGSTIITSVLQTFLNVAEHGMTMQQAVDAPRFHHQWLPDEIMVEPGGIPENTLDSLRSIGYKVKSKNGPILGKVDAILVLPDGRYEGGADRRGDDTAVGY